MPRTGHKQSDFINFAAIVNALGHAHRLEFLELVAQGERSVETLSAWANLTLPILRVTFRSCAARDLWRRGVAASMCCIG